MRTEPSSILRTCAARVGGSLLLGIACFALLFVGSLAAQEEKTKGPDPALPKIEEALRDLVVGVEIRFKPFDKTASADAESYFGYGPANDSFKRLADAKRPFHASGVLANSEKAWVIVADPKVNPAHVESIIVIDTAGKRYEAELFGVLKKHAGIVLRLKDYSQKREQRPIKESLLSDGSKLHVAELIRFWGEPRIGVHAAQLRRYKSSAADSRYEILSESALVHDSEFGAYPSMEETTPLLFNTDGELIGADLGPSGLFVRDTTTGRQSWLTAWPTDDDILAQDQLNAIFERAQKSLEKSIHLVKVEFRETKTDRFASRGYNMRDSEEDVSWMQNEEEIFGLPISQNKLLVPFDIPVQRIEAIQRILVTVGEQQIEGQFLGLLKEFGGFVVSVENKLEPPADLTTEKPLDDLDMFLCMYPVKRFGKAEIECTYNRFFGMNEGYKEHLQRAATRGLKAGSFVTTLDGAIIGFATREKRYENVEEAEQYRSRYSDWGYYPGAFENDLFCSFAELAEYFGEVEKHFDPKARVKTVREAKKQVWFGTEVQGIGPDLAKALKIEKETKDGSLGLLVTTVYENSPAAQIGIQRGDVLLKMKVEAKKDVIELGADLAMGFGGHRDYNYDYDYKRASAIAFMGMRGRNILTNILTRIGAGQKIELTYVHSHEEKTVPLTLEEGPDDLNSAEKYKNELVGVTVKDITYDVRHHLRLADDFTGVVVYKVEPGSPAAVAGLNGVQFVITVNNKPIADIKEFQEVVDGLIASQAKTASFMVWALGQTRFVDVKLEKTDIDPQELMRRWLEEKEGKGEDEKKTGKEEDEE